MVKPSPTVDAASSPTAATIATGMRRGARASPRRGCQNARVHTVLIEYIVRKPVTSAIAANQPDHGVRARNAASMTSALAQKPDIGGMPEIESASKAKREV